MSHPCHQLGRAAQCPLSRPEAVGDQESSEIFARAAVALHPADKSCLGDLARMAAAKGRPDEAIAHLERIVATFGCSPADPYCAQLAQLYTAQGKLWRAQELQQALKKR